MKELFRTRIVDQVMTLLRQGVTPEEISLSIAWGLTLGTIPVLGVATLLCVIAAAALRLNLVAIQAANWASCPLQAVLFVPFFIMGSYLFGTEPVPGGTPALMALFRSDSASAVQIVGTGMLYALVVWAVASPLMIITVYHCVRPVLARVIKVRSRT